MAKTEEEANQNAGFRNMAKNKRKKINSSFVVNEMKNYQFVLS